MWLLALAVVAVLGGVLLVLLLGNAAFLGEVIPGPGDLLGIALGLIAAGLVFLIVTLVHQRLGRLLGVGRRGGYWRRRTHL